MEKGIKNVIETIVTAEKTASAMGSGTLEVFATPSMVALIEETAWKSVTQHLDESQTTVGTKLDIEHLSPTPVGMTVRCETELIEVEGRKLKFNANVYDDMGLIGKGIHERFIVNATKFQSKAKQRK